MQLHLILPGLLWPGKVFHDIASDLDLPALSWLLGRGHLSPQPPRAPEQALCTALGIEDPEPPYAALRLLGDGGTPKDAIWLCADPVHLNIEQRRITLALDATPANAVETAEIVNVLAPHFATIGEFVGGIDGHCYLRLKETPSIITTPPSLAAGYQSMLPQGADALRWRQLTNEAQMLLHTLPRNERRDSARLPRLNSLWFWGAGRLPAGGNLPHGRIVGDDPVLRGLARLMDVPLEQAETPQVLLHERHGSTLLLLNPLQAPARAYDALRWREALLNLECTFLQPLRNTVSNGTVSLLQITALGDEDSFDLALTRHDRLRFWRRPRALHTLAGFGPVTGMRVVP